MKAKDFEEQFEEDVDITAILDVSKAKRVLQEQKRVNVDFSKCMIESLDRKAGKVGVTRSLSLRYGLLNGLKKCSNRLFKADWLSGVFFLIC